MSRDQNQNQNRRDSMVEVFRLVEFDKNTNYEFALYKERHGTWPNERHYAEAGSLKFLGKHTHSERWGGFGDGAGGAENFDNNGVATRIVYDYDGKTCFRVAPNDDIEGKGEDNNTDDDTENENVKTV